MLGLALAEQAGQSNTPAPAIWPILPESDMRSPSRRVFSAAMAGSERPGGGGSRDRVEKRSRTEPAKAKVQSLNA